MNQASPTYICWTDFYFMILACFGLLHVFRLENVQRPTSLLLSHQVSLDACLLAGVRLFSVAGTPALFFGEASATTDGESFFTEESAADGESLLSWLFFSRRKFAGFAYELVHGHLRTKNEDHCYIQIWDIYTKAHRNTNLLELMVSPSTIVSSSKIFPINRTTMRKWTLTRSNSKKKSQLIINNNHEMWK